MGKDSPQRYQKLELMNFQLSQIRPWKSFHIMVVMRKKKKLTEYWKKDIGRQL